MSGVESMAPQPWVDLHMIEDNHLRILQEGCRWNIQQEDLISLAAELKGHVPRSTSTNRLEYCPDDGSRTGMGSHVHQVLYTYCIKQQYSL